MVSPFPHTFGECLLCYRRIYNHWQTFTTQRSSWRPFHSECRPVTDLLIPSLLLILGFVTAVWMLSVLLKRASIIDAFWGPGFAVVALFCLWRSTQRSGQSLTELMPQLALTAMTVLWGTRLGLHLAIRVFLHDTHEDRRYAAMRARHNPGFWLKSLWIVFWLQGLIMWIVALPLQTALAVQQLPWSAAFTWLAVLFWAAGLFFEAVGDRQLARFRANPANQGGLLNRGLWRYTRHPNYFGDFLVWWGLWLFSVNLGAPVWTVLSPTLMSVFLMKFSGVGLLEKDIASRRPDYVHYVRTTNAFFPGRPRH